MRTDLVYTLMAVFLLPLIQIYTSGIDDAEYKLYNKLYGNFLHKLK